MAWEDLTGEQLRMVHEFCCTDEQSAVRSRWWLAAGLGSEMNRRNKAERSVDPISLPELPPTPRHGADS